VEERQQQRADVRAVDIRVGHDDNAVIAQFVGIELLDTNPATERRDHRLDLVAAQHLVEAGFLDVQDLALDGEDRLKLAIASLLRRPAGRFTLDDVEFALCRIALLTVGELAGQTAAVEGALAADEIAGLSRRFARSCGVDRFADDPLGDGGILFEKLPELVVDDRFDDSLDLGVAQLRLRLTLELRLGDLYAD